MKYQRVKESFLDYLTKLDNISCCLVETLSHATFVTRKCTYNQSYNRYRYQKLQRISLAHPHNLITVLCCTIVVYFPKQRLTISSINSDTILVKTACFSKADHFTICTIFLVVVTSLQDFWISLA